MNLIEQLGGYEKAKKSLWQEQEEGYPGYEIAAALLEYRRANNIFEVGDKVVFSNNPCALNHSIYQVTRVIDDMSRFVAVAPICGINGRLIVESSFYVDPPFKIQHATDEEIAAGHRL